MSSVSLKHIYKVYPGGVRAVNDFNLNIKDKEFVVFVGPSGCGKSTTLRMIAGIEDITAGQLYIDDKLMNEVDSKDRDIAMVFQSYALYPHMTVYQNMAFGLKLRHVNPSIIDEKVKCAAQILEITDLLDRKPKELSGGQRQRVALGRAIVREPNVFLLDEPLSNLDAKLRVQMRTEITKLHENLQTTFIYVTHDQTEAMTMGDRIVVMKDGYIQQADTPVTLFEDPANLFVATFLGAPQMNIIDVKLENRGEDIYARFASNNSHIVKLPEQIAKQLNANKYDLNRDVLLGIRPDHIHFAKDGIPAVIDVIEQLGDETIVYLKLEGREKFVVCKTSLTGSLEQGKEVKLAFDDNAIYLFDKKLEHSIVGVPSLNKFPCDLREQEIVFGKEKFVLNETYFKYLLKPLISSQVFVGFRPEEVYLEEIPDSHPINVKIDFVNAKTKYRICYAKVEGLDNYLVFRTPLEKEFKIGEKVVVYVPTNAINLYDENGDRLSSREEIMDNAALVNVLNKGAQTIVKINGGKTLVFPKIDVDDGEYAMKLNMDKIRVIYSQKYRQLIKKQNKVEKKKNKHNFVPTEIPEIQNFNPSLTLDVSCYDEDIIGNRNIVFAKINGFEDYVTLVCDNTFSVYKMPVFKIELSPDSIELNPVKQNDNN